MGIVSFGPSSWSKGTYLDVSAMWLWDRKDYITLDLGERIGQFVEFESEAQFAREAQRLALSAREHLIKLREQFPNIEATARFLHNYALRITTPWPKFHAALALGYAGERSAAEIWFSRLNEMTAEYEWQQALQAKAGEFGGLLHDVPAFRKRVREETAAARRLLKLPELGDLGLPL